MKYRHSDVLKGIIGIVLIISAITGIYYWETYGRQVFTTKKVVVLKEDLPPNKKITEEDLMYVNRETTTLTQNPVLAYDEIVGRVTKHFLPANTQLIRSYFEEDGLIPKEGEYVFQLPSDWIRSCPSTLRRSDDAYIYPVRRTEDKETPDRKEIQRELAKLVDEIASETPADTDGADLKASETESESEGESVESDTNTLEPQAYAEEKLMLQEPIRCLKIAFVKNQSNQEVKSISSQDRLNGTSTISTIEMIATMEDIELLTALHDNGYDFIIMYR